jgi:RND family efflux transporter MFP subunit
MLHPLLRSTLFLSLAWAATGLASAQDTRTVVVIQPGRADLTEGFTLVGTLEPTVSAVIIPRVTGYLSDVTVDVGDQVQRGDLLAVVHAPDLEAALARAEAESRAQVSGVAQAEAGVEDARAAGVESEAAVHVARARLARRKAEEEMTRVLAQVQEKETARTRGLVGRGAATPEQLEAAEGALATARAAERSALAGVDIAESEIGAAQARVLATRTAFVSAQVAVEAAEALVQAAEAAAAQARTRLGFCRLESPFDGAVVTSRYLHPGAHVSADQTEVLVVMDTRVLRVVLPVPEGDSGRLTTGLSVDLVFSAEVHAARQAKVSRISGALDRSTRTVRVEVDLDNRDNSLRPGMFCRATVTVRDIPGAITLPGGAIHTRSGADGEPETFVWIARDGVAHQVLVDLGIDDGILVEVRRGLKGDEAVISSGAASLREGIAVALAEGGTP